MSTTTQLTLEQYDRMIAEGAFVSEKRLRMELLEGELCEMSPIGTTHEDFVDYLNKWSIVNLGDRARVRVQNSIGIPASQSAPEPDIAWVTSRRYLTGRPESEEVFLIIEVSDSSLAIDRGRKARIYAAAGIQDYWIVNVADQSVEVYRQPEQGHYASMQIFSGGAEIRPMAFPDFGLCLSDLFGAA